MRFKPRHYLLIAVIVGLGIFNYVRTRRLHSAPDARPGVLTRGTAPAWDLFDRAARLRDADDATFPPALKTLNDAIDDKSANTFPPRPAEPELNGLRGCRTWLLFYRQEHLHPSTREGWAQQTRAHVDSCQARHQDTSQ